MTCKPRLQESEVQYREIQASDRDVSLESSTSAKHRARLKPVRTKLSDTREPALQGLCTPRNQSTFLLT